MIDLSKAAEPKSDQLNADDLIGGPRTLKITGVKFVGGDQPVHIEYEGSEGRPFKPCISMIRVLIAAWTKNGENYVGRSIVVYNDTRVKWGGSEVGGIRISHASDIDNDMRIMLTEKRGKKVPYLLKALRLFAGNPLTEEAMQQWTKAINAAKTMAELSAVGAGIKKEKYNDQGRELVSKFYQSAVERIRASESE